VGFFFYGVCPKTELRKYRPRHPDVPAWDVVNSDLSFQNNPGFGTHFGGELTVYVTNQFGYHLKYNYLMGSSKYH